MHRDAAHDAYISLWGKRFINRQDSPSPAGMEVVEAPHGSGGRTELLSILSTSDCCIRSHAPALLPILQQLEHGGLNRFEQVAVDYFTLWHSNVLPTFHRFTDCLTAINPFCIIV